MPEYPAFVSVDEEARLLGFVHQAAGFKDHWNTTWPVMSLPRSQWEVYNRNFEGDDVLKAICVANFESKHDGRAVGDNGAAWGLYQLNNKCTDFEACIDYDFQMNWLKENTLDNIQSHNSGFQGYEKRVKKCVDYLKTYK